MTTSARSKRSVSRAKAPIAGRKAAVLARGGYRRESSMRQADRSARDRLNKPPKSLADEVGFSIDGLNLETYSTLRRKLTNAQERRGEAWNMTG